ncbi:MAG: hypothetical protein HXS53_12820 [Theionarchaea archaeon]|nr:hypothetical protein [Theionarchaea archaeon]
MVTCSCDDLTFRVVLRGDILSHVFIRNPKDSISTIQSISVDGKILVSDLNMKLRGNAMNKVDLLPYKISTGSTLILIFNDGNQLVINH